eukprot:TRINITY_DN19854_c0_g1_i1.p1 TRINITY_DN19854_c0_g1~~TRINITY_DN19854_c0_g1_i1.p1  ORF type:complete len:206 (+),score=12.01 TRINITY_DN19854_c0_g1_i1:63-680(+)
MDCADTAIDCNSENIEISKWNSVGMEYKRDVFGDSVSEAYMDAQFRDFRFSHKRKLLVPLDTETSSIFLQTDLLIFPLLLVCYGVALVYGAHKLMHTPDLSRDVFTVGYLVAFVPWYSVWLLRAASRMSPLGVTWPTVARELGLAGRVAFCVLNVALRWEGVGRFGCLVFPPCVVIVVCLYRHLGWYDGRNLLFFVLARCPVLPA